jgi:ArsR family transcriptional regulator
MSRVMPPPLSVTSGALDRDQAARLAQVFRALGDPARVRLLSLVAAAPGSEATVRDLTAAVGLAQATVSHHMRVLADAGLVTRHQRGRWAHFGLERDALQRAAASLGGPQGTAPTS